MPPSSAYFSSPSASAFIALGNILFISLAGLLPDFNVGMIVVIMGGSGLVNLLLLVADIQQRGLRHEARGTILLLGSMAIYALEVWWGAELLRDPARISALENVTTVLLITYAVALARAWGTAGRAGLQPDPLGRRADPWTTGRGR